MFTVEYAESIRDEQPLKALEIYQEMFGENTQNFWAGYWSALLTKWNKSNTDSILIFEELLNSYPESDLVKVELAQNYFEIGQYESALELTYEVVDLEYTARAAYIQQEITRVHNEVVFRGNFARPDDKDSFALSNTTAWTLPEANLGFELELEQLIWPNQNNTDISSASLAIQRGATEINLGVALLDQATFPEIGIETIAFSNAEDGSLTLRYDYQINAEDPQAIQEEIKQHFLSASYSRGRANLTTQFMFNSDDVLVTQSFAEVRLTKSNLLALTSYVRTSSQDSDNYWTPGLFTNTGLRIAFPVGDNCNAGVIPGIKYEDGEGYDFSLPFGGSCNFGDISLDLRVDYGISFTTRYRF